MRHFPDLHESDADELLVRRADFRARSCTLGVQVSKISQSPGRIQKKGATLGVYKLQHRNISPALGFVFWILPGLWEDVCSPHHDYDSQYRSHGYSVFGCLGPSGVVLPVLVAPVESGVSVRRRVGEPSLRQKVHGRAFGLRLWGLQFRYR